MYIIAEIGFNHNGSLETALQLIEQAAEAGADAVKFQTFKAEDIALPASPHFELIRSGELDLDKHKQLKQKADATGVAFISTPFSLEAVDILEEIAVPAYKVASMDCTNFLLLERIAQTGKPVYLSTGMATLDEISATVDFMKKQNSGPVSLLHCISHYPPEEDEINLAMISALQDIFGLPTGYSDHFPGIKGCLAAAMAGAEIIETHFTHNIKANGPDHHHSVDKTMLKQLTDDLKMMQKMYGSAAAFFNRPDRDCAPLFRRGVYSAKDLSKGHILTLGDLRICREQNDFTPNDTATLLGKRLNRNLPANSPVSPDLFD